MNLKFNLQQYKQTPTIWNILQKNQMKLLKFKQEEWGITYKGIDLGFL
jgi:hypothetical protein